MENYISTYFFSYVCTDRRLSQKNVLELPIKLEISSSGVIPSQRMLPWANLIKIDKKNWSNLFKAKGRLRILLKMKKVELFM